MILLLLTARVSVFVVFLVFLSTSGAWKIVESRDVENREGKTIGFEIVNLPYSSDLSILRTEEVVAVTNGKVIGR